MGVSSNSRVHARCPSASLTQAAVARRSKQTRLMLFRWSVSQGNCLTRGDFWLSCFPNLTSFIGTEVNVMTAVHVKNWGDLSQLSVRQNVFGNTANAVGELRRTLRKGLSSLEWFYRLTRWHHMVFMWVQKLCNLHMILRLPAHWDCLHSTMSPLITWGLAHRLPKTT